MAWRPETISFDNRPRFHWAWVGVLLALAGVALIYSRVDGQFFNRASQSSTDLASPALAAISRTSLAADGLWTNFELFLYGRGELRRLQREIAELQHWRLRARELERENAELRALAQVQVPSRGRAITARIIGGAHGPFFHSVILNSGRASGILDGSPVLDSSGLVGRVVGLGEQTSRVLLLTDRNSQVPVQLLPSGVHAVLAGAGRAYPELRLIDGSSPLKVGEEIITSGEGGVFAAGLSVGRIAAIDDVTPVVTLAAKFDQLDFVRIIDPAGAAPISPPGIITNQPATNRDR